jgi:Zn-finger nucleic acid-binding protein
LDHEEIDELFSLPKIPERFLNMERYREPPPSAAEGNRVCPRCEERLKVIAVDGISLDACSGCKGVFCDLGELRLLAEAAERRFEVSQEQDKKEDSHGAVM